MNIDCSTVVPRGLGSPPYALDQLNARLLGDFTADEQTVVARWLNHAAAVLSEEDGRA